MRRTLAMSDENAKPVLVIPMGPDYQAHSRLDDGLAQSAIWPRRGAVLLPPMTR